MHVGQFLSSSHEQFPPPPEKPIYLCRQGGNQYNQINNKTSRQNHVWEPWKVINRQGSGLIVTTSSRTRA